MCLLLPQLAICTSLPRHNLTTKVPLRLHNNRSGRNRGGIALAITRELALHHAWDSSALARAKQRTTSTTNHIVDEVIEYYGQQHDKILRELLLPSLSNVKGEDEAVSKPSKVSSVRSLSLQYTLGRMVRMGYRNEHANSTVAVRSAGNCTSWYSYGSP